MLTYDTIFKTIVSIGALGWIFNWLKEVYRNRPTQVFRNLSGDLVQVIAAIELTQRYQDYEDSDKVKHLYQYELLPVILSLNQLGVNASVSMPHLNGSDGQKELIADWLRFFKTVRDLSESGNLKGAKSLRNGRGSE